MTRGVLWVAATYGLVRFDRKREQFTTYDERDGLPASSVKDIVEDHEGILCQFQAIEFSYSKYC